MWRTGCGQAGRGFPTRLVRSTPTKHIRLRSRDPPFRRRWHTTFTVFHWNVLASYLGKNTNPWFLHGISLDAERRSQIFDQYYAREESTNALRNPGWPSYAKHILTQTEIDKVEQIDTEIFHWPKRLEKINRILVNQGADIISLVELDAFEDIQKHLTQYGYAGEYAARPRIVSKDGCGIFWKRSDFKLMNKSKLIFIDKYKPDPKKDRCALVVLLHHRVSNQPLVVVSTHLARDVLNKAPRDAIRARQMGELAAHIKEFIEESKLLVEDIPVVLCGDVNADSMAKLTGLVQVSALMSSPASARRLHPFIFSCKAVDTRGVTSRTEAREARVDAILFTASLVDAQGLELSGPIEQEKRSIIPNQVIPSDHFPLLAQLGILSPSARVTRALRRWWTVVLPSCRRVRSTIEQQLIDEDPWIMDAQLDARELALAFDRLDVNNNGKIELKEALESLRKLDLLKSLSTQSKTALLRQRIFNTKSTLESGIDFVDFCAAYFLAHPVCERCANVAFDHIDSAPRNDFLTLDELSQFFRPFEKSPLEGNAGVLYADATQRGLVQESSGLRRTAFKLLLGARFVETIFEDEHLRYQIVQRMGAAPFDELQMLSEDTDLGPLKPM